MQSGSGLLVLLCTPCDGIKYYLLHNFPWYGGGTDRPIFPYFLLSAFLVEGHRICQLQPTEISAAGQDTGTLLKEAWQALLQDPSAPLVHPIWLYRFMDVKKCSRLLTTFPWIVRLHSSPSDRCTPLNPSTPDFSKVITWSM